MSSQKNKFFAKFLFLFAGLLSLFHISGRLQGGVISRGFLLDDHGLAADSLPQETDGQDLWVDLAGKSLWETEVEGSPLVEQAPPLFQRLDEQTALTRHRLRLFFRCLGSSRSLFMMTHALLL